MIRGGAKRIVFKWVSLHFAEHALYLIATFAGGFKGAFDGFGAAVHGQNLMRAGQGADVFIEQRQLIVAERPRRQGQFRHLIGQRLENLWMAMALIDVGIGGQAIQIPGAIVILHPNAFAAGENNVERLINMGAQLIFNADIIGR